MWNRILFSIAMLFSTLYLPFYVTLCIMILGMFIFEIYIEGIFFMLISDIIFGAPQVMYANVTMVSFFFALLMLGIVELLKKRLKFYRKNT